MLNLKKLANLYFLPIVSGILIGTSYIPFPPWALFFCYTPLFYFWLNRAENIKQVFLGGWITQFILSIIGFHWIAYTAHEFGQLPWAAAAIVLLLFCTLVHLFVPLMGVLWWYTKKHFDSRFHFGLLVVFAIACELFWPALFAWNLGYPWIWLGWPGYQLADMIGFEGLSALSFLANAWILYIWTQRENVKSWAPQLAALVLIFVGLQYWGAERAKPWSKTDREISTLHVQANIGNSDKIEAEKGETGYQAEILRRFLALTKQGLEQFPSTQLIIWPETAFPDYLNSNYRYNDRNLELFNFIKEQKRALFTGAYSKDPPNPPGDKKERQIYNGAFLIDENGRYVAEPYHKSILLAFGEYYPFTERFPILQKWTGLSNFGRGLGPGVLAWQDAKIGVQICYEGLYPWFSRGLSDRGANMIVNITNDSWFGRDFEPKQHLYMTLSRAIETRRPLIRTTNTGISTAILADGTLLEQSPVLAEWVGEIKVPYQHNPKQSFYTRYGYHWPWLLVIATAFMWVAGILIRKREPK